TAKTVIERLNAGEDFAKLAAELSTDTSNKDQGGDLGWFVKGDMIPEFEDVAFKLGIGEISEPVKTTFGYHIIQVLGHETRPVAADKLEQLQSNAFQKWLTDAAATDTVKKTDAWKEYVPTDPALTAAA
ncbi:MAG TPA: peptidylprolyl isomerase, partial [Anaerolineaceae bacterium]|nr:peptidylprolyl isomerase [Anaerolineaceae bacterium]